MSGTLNIDRRRYLKSARGLEERLRHQACITRNGDSTARGENLAGQLTDEANAIAWLIREAEGAYPELALGQEIFDALHGGA